MFFKRVVDFGEGLFGVVFIYGNPALSLNRVFYDRTCAVIYGED